jgi:hypothetical protein
MDNQTQPAWLQNHVPAPNPGNPNWKKGGPSPNPAGKPRGITDKRAKLLRQMLDDANDVYDGILAKAKEGDASSAALIFARVLPALRTQLQTVQFDFDPGLPIAKQVEQVLAAVAAGEVAPDVGQTIVAMIGTLSTVRASEELELRIVQLEAKAVPQ